MKPSDDDPPDDRDAAAEVEARDRLYTRLREANEKLVIVALRAEEAADKATAAQVEIGKSEERFRSFVTTTAAVVWHASAEGLIHVDPESWCRFTGIGDEEPGWGWLQAVHPDDREPVRAAWARAVARRTAYAHQHRIRSRDGSYAWVASSAVPIQESGAVREWIGTMTDISDRIRVDEARDRFIGILGHDLVSPLGAILIAVQVLEGDDVSEQAKTTIAGIRKSAHQMRAVIRDVLDFARGRLGGGIPIKRTRCDLGRICADEMEAMKRAHPGRAIGCRTSGDLVGEWDADRIVQVLSNLLANAIQHGSDPIRIEARGASAEVNLSVHNEGTPIPTSMIPHLFEPFHTRRTDAPEGLGLGLYIVSEIVRSHGGIIVASSSEAEGTMFTIRFPRHAPAMGAPDPVTPASR